MIAIFGAPGSGKSVQGSLLQAKYGWRWVSSRDLYAKLHDKDISLALNYGMPVSEEKSLQVLDRVLSNNNSGQRLILDGFPTSVSQLYWMVEHDKIKDLEGAIILRVPRGELWKRLVARKRVDDTRAGIERRQDLYDRVTTGMLNVLKSNGVQYRYVDGSNSPEDVLERIEEVLGDWEIIPKKQYEKI